MTLIMSPVAAFTVLILAASFDLKIADAQMPVILYRRSAVNLTLTWDEAELAMFAGSFFGMFLDSVYYFFAYSVAIAAPVLTQDSTTAEYLGGRARTFIVHKPGGFVDFVVEISDLQFSDSLTITLRKMRKISGGLTYGEISTAYLVLGPPEECGAGLYASPVVKGTSFYANVTLCANPQPTVYFNFGGKSVPAAVVEINNPYNFTFYFSIMKVYQAASILSYEASNSVGGHKNFTVLMEDVLTPACLINNGACEQTCFDGSCSCYKGELKNDGRTCTEHEFLAFAARTYIATINANLTTVGKLVHPYPPLFGMGNAVGLDYNHDTEVFYVTDTGRQVITQVGFDGSNTRILKAEQSISDGIAFDWVRKQLYWTEATTKTIRYLDLSSNMDKVVYQSSQATSIIRAIALRPQECDRIIFWTDCGATAHIARSSMESINPVFIVSTDIKWPNGLTIDHEKKNLYWVDGYLDRIESCDFSGNNREMILLGAGNGFGIQLFDGFIYWTARPLSAGTTGLYRYKSGVKETVVSTSKDAFGLVVVARKREYQCDITTTLPARNTDETTTSNDTVLITTTFLTTTASVKCTIYSCPRYSDCWEVPGASSPVCRCYYSYVMVYKSCVKVIRYVEARGLRLAQSWRTEFADSNSPEHKRIVMDVEYALLTYLKVKDSDVLSVVVTRLLPGSVIVNFDVVYGIDKDVNVNDLIQMLRTGVLNGQLKLEAYLGDIEVLDPKVRLVNSKSSSTGIIVGIVVGVTAAVIVATLLVGGILYRCRKTSQAPRLPQDPYQFAAYSMEYASLRRPTNPYGDALPPTYEEIPAAKGVFLAQSGTVSSSHGLQQEAFRPARPPLVTTAEPTYITDPVFVPRYGNIKNPGLLVASSGVSNQSYEALSAPEASHYEVEHSESTPSSSAVSRSGSIASHLSTRSKRTNDIASLKDDHYESFENYLSMDQ